MEMAEKNEYINEAYQALKHISEDDQKRYEYEAREKAIRDYNHQMKTNYDSGLKDGEQRGEKRGEKRGMELINQLNQQLIKDGRTDDLLASSSNMELQRHLMLEYGLLESEE